MTCDLAGLDVKVERVEHGRHDVLLLHFQQRRRGTEIAMLHGGQRKCAHLLPLLLLLLLILMLLLLLLILMLLLLILMLLLLMLLRRHG